MVSGELLRRIQRLVNRINAFGRDVVPETYALVEKVADEEARYIEGYYLPPVVALSVEQRAAILTDLEASWDMVEDEEAASDDFSANQRRLRMRWGNAVIGVAWYLVLPTEMKEILNQDFRRFADDAVVKISRWYYATTGWNAQCRRYAQTVVNTAWQGRIDKFRDGITRVWQPPGLKVIDQGGKPTKKKAAVGRPQPAQTNEDERAAIGPQSAQTNENRRAAAGRPQPSQSNEDEREAVKRALAALSDSDLQVIARCPPGLPEIARQILADRKSMTVDGATDRDSGKASEIKVANRGRKQSKTFDQVRSDLLAVRHGHKRRDGAKWVLSTKHGVVIKTFDEEAALDQWWREFQHSQGRKPLPLIVSPARKKSSGKSSPTSAKTTTRSKRSRPAGARILPAQGQTRKVGSHRSVS